MYAGLNQNSSNSKNTKESLRTPRVSLTVSVVKLFIKYK